MSLRRQADALRAGKRSLTDELALLKARAAETAALRPLAWVDWERAAREAQVLTDQIGREPDRAAQRLLLGAFASRVVVAWYYDEGNRKFGHDFCGC